MLVIKAQTQSIKVRKEYRPVVYTWCMHKYKQYQDDCKSTYHQRLL